MQKSLMTSRMQSSCWVNYDRPMTLFAAAVRAGLAQQSLATVKRKTIVMHARTLWVHIEACLPYQPGCVGCMALRRKPHLCSEALNPRCEPALHAIVGGSPWLACKRRERLAPPVVIPADTPIPVRVAEVAIPG